LNSSSARNAEANALYSKARSVCCFAMNAGYRHAFETTNEFVRMKF